MSLAEFPLLVALVGLTAYAVLAGADFGAGFWTLFAGRARAEEVREHAHRALAPVWEANHVWLVFVLVIVWTAYPAAFGALASTLAVPLFIAAVGIILRGSTYVLRSAAGTSRLGARADVVFALASILTPFALGTAVGGIASGRVPEGNAAGDLLTSWLNPTSVFAGVVAVVTGAYLAAVYLAADASRTGRRELAEAFRLRALAAGVAAGTVAAAGLGVVYWDARSLWDGLVGGVGVVAVVASGAAGAATLALVTVRRYEPARATAAVAVAAVVAGWALAQRPFVLPPRLTIEEAAAGRATLVAVAVAAAIAAVVLVPSLWLLYTLVLRGRFDAAPSEAAEPSPERAALGAPARDRTPGGRRAVAAAGAAFVVGSALTVFAGAGWLRALGIAALLVFLAGGFMLLARPPDPRARE
jgi:cytochrome d ubiquinol oxidase subunit II